MIKKKDNLKTAKILEPINFAPEPNLSWPSIKRLAAQYWLRDWGPLT